MSDPIKLSAAYPANTAAEAAPRNSPQARTLGGKRPLRVMLCDDSALARTMLQRMLETDPMIRVVAQAADGRQALQMHAMAEPDIVLLDLEMPVLDGMATLPLLLATAHPPLVIVASALTQRGAAAAMAALRAGAVDYLPKPSGQGLQGDAFLSELLAKVRGWGRMAPRMLEQKPAGPPPPPRREQAGARNADVAPLMLGTGLAEPRPAGAPQLRKIPTGFSPRALAIGSSTGGPKALTDFLGKLRVLPVPVVLVQHLPVGFSAMLADHLGHQGAMPCREASNGMTLQPGHLYLAPAGTHLLVVAEKDALVAQLNDGPQENFCRPAVDPLLRSLTDACRGAVLATILTGMGQDGLLGARHLCASGGVVFAQDAQSSVVWGMPGAVAKDGLASALLPPAELAAKVNSTFLGYR